MKIWPSGKTGDPLERDKSISYKYMFYNLSVSSTQGGSLGIPVICRGHLT